MKGLWRNPPLSSSTIIHFASSPMVAGWQPHRPKSRQRAKVPPLKGLRGLRLGPGRRVVDLFDRGAVVVETRHDVRHGWDARGQGFAADRGRADIVPDEGRGCRAGRGRCWGRFRSWRGLESPPGGTSGPAGPGAPPAGGSGICSVPGVSPKIISSSGVGASSNPASRRCPRRLLPAIIDSRFEKMSPTVKSTAAPWAGHRGSPAAPTEPSTPPVTAPMRPLSTISMKSLRVAKGSSAMRA